MKIYTKTGDGGATGLFGGQRIDKDAVRIEAYGTIDELNACIGAAVSLVQDEEIAGILTRVQNELFVVGGDLATPNTSEASSTAVSGVPRVTAEMTLRLEAEIDRFTEEVGQLQHFILPGGATAGAIIHQARCVCRRAERVIVHLRRGEPITAAVLPYINRLSDHLFELARLINHRLDVSETIWSRETYHI